MIFELAVESLRPFNDVELYVRDKVLLWSGSSKACSQNA